MVAMGGGCMDCILSGLGLGNGYVSPYNDWEVRWDRGGGLDVILT